MCYQPLHTASSTKVTMGQREHGLRAWTTPHGPPPRFHDGGCGSFFIDSQFLAMFEDL